MNEEIKRILEENGFSGGESFFSNIKFYNNKNRTRIWLDESKKNYVIIQVPFGEVTLFEGTINPNFLEELILKNLL